MFCSNCGKQLPDDVKFCTGCGTPVDAPAAPEAAPAPAAPVAPAPAAPAAPARKKSGKGIVLPVIIGVAVVVVALILALVTGLFTSNKVKLAKALNKSVKSYQATAFELKIPEIYDDNKDMVSSQTLSVWVKSMPTEAQVEGMGVQLDMDVNVPGREAQMIATARYASAEIISAELLLQDAELYADVPQITGGKPFMVNTETIGQTLVNYGVEEEGVDALGFNLFDLMQLIKDSLPLDAKFELPEEAVKEFTKAIEVEKVGKKDRSINDHSLKCTVYDVVIPEKAMTKLVKECIKALPEYDPADGLDLIVDICREIGIPEDVILELEADMANTSGSMDDAIDEVYDIFDMAMEAIGDIELEVSVHKGYVVSVYYENSVEDVDVEITIDLGGGDNYVDDLSIEAIIDDAELILVSNGNHAGKDGVYTDTTTVEISIYGEDVEVSSELTFEPGASDENFNWVLDADVAKVELVGNITTGKTEACIRLDEISVWAEGTKMATFGMELSVREYEGTTMNTAGAIDLGAITMDQLYEEVMAMEGTAMAWAESIMTNYPELAEILDNL